jgi:lipopolysaccharide transport system ATP-binding protein
VNDIALRVENLSKQYKLGTGPRRHDTLRDHLVEGTKSLFRRIGRRPSTVADQSDGRSSARGHDATIWALKDVSFEVKRGEIVGFVGHNGAGKSTLLKILSRITHPTNGRAEVYGRVGSLLEVGTGFHAELTGLENIYLNGAILGMKKAEIDRKLQEIVEFSGIEQFMNTPVKRYSSGMYVRLAFAVAAHLEPDILILDEVLAVGDSSFQKKCLGKMRDVTSEGRTVLFVSHNMAAIQGLCSKCYLLSGGRIIAEGSPKSVVEQYLADASIATRAQLGRRKDRQGSGEIRFLDVAILDAKRRRIDGALSGQDIAIVVSYGSRGEKPLSRLDVHITFYTSSGQFMFSCSSEGSGHPFEVAPPTGQVVCHIPELPLAPGRYSFNLFSTVGGVVADWVQEADVLHVAAGDYFGTGQLKTHEDGFLVKHKWTAGW